MFVTYSGMYIYYIYFLGLQTAQASHGYTASYIAWLH